MTHHELLLMLRRYRLVFLFIFIVTSAASGYIFIPWVLKYEGESTFYLANESMVNPALFAQKGSQDLLQVNLVQERVYQLAYSTQMMTYMIKRFNLYDHYHIDSTKAYHFERAIRMLTKNIRFNKVTSDLSSIVVTDRNNEMASAMANAIVWKLDLLNKQYLSDKIQANLNFYDSFLKESLRITNEQNLLMREYMTTLGTERKKSPESSVLPLPEVEFSLYQAAARIGDITSQLVMARNFYSQAMNTRNSKNLPSLVIIKRAMPDLISKKPDLVLFALLAGLVGTVSSILVAYFYFSYKTEMKILFGRKMPEQNTGTTA